MKQFTRLILFWTATCFAAIAWPVVLSSFLPALAIAENEGLEDLDQAFERKLKVERASDLERVAQLCESALEKGLDEQNTQLARKILSGTLYERASTIAGSILEGEIDRNWVRRRQLALVDLKRAAKGNPDDAEVQLMIARLNALPGGDSDVGRAAASKATDLMAGNPERLSIALVARAFYQKDASIKMADYDEAIRIDKTNALAWRDRGRAKLEIGKPAEAVEDFFHILEQNPDDLDSLQLAAEALSGLGDVGTAADKLDRLIENNPNSSSGYSLRARMRAMQEDFDGAISDLDKAIEIDPKDLVGLMMRAQMNMGRGEPQKSVADLTRILRLRPGMPQAILLRSTAHAAAKNYDSSIADLNTILQRDPDNVDIRLQIATVYGIDERPRKAISIYNEILEQDSEQWEAMRSRADAYLGIGKHREALADYVILYEQLPDDSNVLNNFAWVLATSTIDELRDGKRALELAKKACEFTEYKAPHILSTLASAHAEIGDFEKAIEWTQKALDMSNDEIKEHLKKELASYQAEKPWREMQLTEEKPEPPAPSPDDLLIDDDATDEPTPEDAETEPAGSES